MLLFQKNLIHLGYLMKQLEEPNDGNKYIWNESTTTWDILDTEEDLEIIDNP